MRTHSATRSADSCGLLIRVILPLVVVLLSNIGCQRALFPSDKPRTQFQTYDRLRQNDAPLEENDVFGRPQPALRARLTPSSS
ncbi:MAG: hypothetical protein O2800_06370 [Planctomycetota bacterium]|nr:hypothetical protein [Planctomycetota bacterium]